MADITKEYLALRDQYIESRFARLNPVQRQAVFATEGPLLILAGAGSGKTTVLVNRIANIIRFGSAHGSTELPRPVTEADLNDLRNAVAAGRDLPRETAYLAVRPARPWNVLAITFTNKAAGELKERLRAMLGDTLGGDVNASTFHSACVRMLRRDAERIGFPKSFTIYDSDDQQRVIKQIYKDLMIDDKFLPVKSAIGQISSFKDKLLSAEDVAGEPFANTKAQLVSKIYTAYAGRLKAAGAMDFDDLIFHTVKLLQNDAEAREYYQNRFRYVVVDEYQDTSIAQFHLVRLLAGGTNNVCVVGDDDQSIYKFRGANIYNILNFETEYPDAKVIKLEKNYRSTQNILDAANAVISHNSMRKDKALWTDQEKGDPIYFAQYGNEYEEAEAVTDGISYAVQTGEADYKDFAILYRTNAQSRVLEEKLVTANIPYRIVGAVNFYQRREIKDLLAYLRTVENGLDDISVKRIINVPKRGIGLTTIDRVADYALTHETSFYGALQNYEYIDGIKRSAGKLGSFVSLIESFKRHLASPEYSLEDLIREIIEETGYVRLLEEEDTEEANGRIENIEEFINKVVTYEENCEEEPTLSGFLEEVALVADIDTVDDDNNMVLLMTLHSAKGLEFPYVYLVGMEDGIFPGYAAVMGDDPEEMEEERRLCYVGITRAKQKLSLSCARSRFRNGEQQYNRPSSFLNEIPRYLLKQNGDAFQDSSRTASSPFSGNSFTESRRQSYHQVRMNELPNVRTNASSTWDPMAERSAKQAVRRSSGADLFAGNPLIRKGIGSSSQAGDIYRSKGSSLRDSSIFDKGNSGKTTSGTLSYGEGDRIKHKKFGEGTVIALKEKNGDHEVTVDFDNGSTRRMMASFAKLKKI